MTLPARQRQDCRLTERLNLAARASMIDLMRRRSEAGKSTAVPAVAKAVLWAMVNRSADDGRAFPGLQRISAESETSERTVRRVVAILADEGVVTVTHRNRGANAARKSGADGGARTLYTFDWEVLRSMDPEHESPASVAGEHRTAETRTPDSLTGEHRTAETRTPDSGDQNTGQLGDRSKEVEPIEPFEPPPPTPPQAGGSTAGGAGEALRVDTATPSTAEPGDVASADRILAALPRTGGDAPASDLEAALAAIRGERAMGDGATVDEIVAAARDYAAKASSGSVREPRWPRKWLAERCYWRHVVAMREARRRADATAGPTEAELAAAERARLAEQRRRFVDEPLDALSDEQLEALRIATLESLPPLTRSILGGDDADARSNRNLRVYMAHRLAEHGLPTAEREAVVA